MRHLRQRTNLNRTRLECKDLLWTRYSFRMYIWIEPDWNVKTEQTYVPLAAYIIWIEPDWNVKFCCSLSFLYLNFHLNRTRLECKEKVSTAVMVPTTYLNRTRLECKELYIYLFTKIFTIWIEPDWNVKSFVSILSIQL